MIDFENRFRFPLHIVLLVLSIIIMALGAAVIAGFAKIGISVAEWNFYLFATLLSLISAFVLIMGKVVGSMPLTKRIVVLIIEGTNMIIIFIAALQAYLGLRIFASLLPDFVTVCNCGAAAAAFGAVTWLVWMICFIFTLLAFLEDRKGGGSGSGSAGPPPPQNS